MVKHDYSVSINKVNLISLGLAIPLFLGVLLIYLFIWGWEWLDIGVDLLLNNPFQVAMIFVIGIIAHELLHGLTWQWLSGEHDSVEYGLKWKTLTPYTHITRPISMEAYATGTIMPALILGILPTMMALIEGSSALLMFGLIFTWSASGDGIVLWRLRHIEADTLVEDHPTNAGVYVYDTNMSQPHIVDHLSEDNSQ